MPDKKDKPEEGFKVVDRRIKFDEAPEEKKTEPAPRASAPEGPTVAAEDRLQAEYDAKTTCSEREIPLPPINFTTFILSLSTSVLIHLGAAHDPLSRKLDKNLPLARQTIDLLGILKEKTRGNLDKEEKAILEQILYDLRMRYVTECQKG